MKRFALGIVIFVLAVTVSSVSQKAFINDAQMLMEKTQNMLNSAGERPDEKLKMQLRDLIESFKKVENRLNIILCHSDIEGIENNILSLQGYLKADDFGAFKLCCVQIISQIENLIDSLKLSVKNIL